MIRSKSIIVDQQLKVPEFMKGETSHVKYISFKIVQYRCDAPL